MHTEASIGKELQKSSKRSRSQMSKNCGGGELHTMGGRLQRNRRLYALGQHLPRQRRARRRPEAATIFDTKRSLRLLNGARLRATGPRRHGGKRKMILVWSTQRHHQSARHQAKGVRKTRLEQSEGGTRDAVHRTAQTWNPFLNLSWLLRTAYRW